MGNTANFFKSEGGQVVKTSAKAIKTVAFVTVAAVALGLGVGAVQGGFSG